MIALVSCSINMGSITSRFSENKPALTPVVLFSGRIKTRPRERLKSSLVLTCTAGPDHPSNGSSEARGNYGENSRWPPIFEFDKQKSKMAANVRFAESLHPALLRAKSDCLGQTLSGDGIRRVNQFFSELEDAVEVLEDKFSKRSTFANVQRLIASRGMVGRALRKVHLKIVRRLHTRPKLANPWLGEFTMDMPLEVFSCISKDIMDRTTFGHHKTDTNTQSSYRIIDIRKAKYLF